MDTIDYNSYRAVTSFNHRIRFLVLHYTAENFKDSINSLTGPSVSVHYLIPDPTEQSYVEAGFTYMHVFNIVDENERAWHAGVSSWKGRTNLNDTSIGVEIVNLATDDGNGTLTFPKYKKAQINAIKKLAINILQRYPDITPTNIIGHSDIAPGRKSDPGPVFPWKELYKAGIGAWYDDEAKIKYEKIFSDALPSQDEILTKLSNYGYDISDANNEEGFKRLIRAFQLHFRGSKYDGVLDVESAAILYALVEKYID